MLTNVINQNFGYSVTCDGYWAAVGNPGPFRWNPLTASVDYTGSVEVYKYNINTDVHDRKDFLYRPLRDEEKILLSTEAANPPPTGPYYILHTEYTGSIPYTADKDLEINTRDYFVALEDGYGWSIDLRDTLLAVGCPYYTSEFIFPATESFFFTGSGFVDLFDLSTLDVDPYARRTNPSIIGTGSLGGHVTIITQIPANQNYTIAIFQTKPHLGPDSEWVNVAAVEVSNSGGTFVIQTNYDSIDPLILDSRVVGVIGTDPYLMSINNPNTSITNSFGYKVSLNDEWLAVGSPLESGSKGAVFMFRKINGNELSWSFIQTLPTPSDISVGDNFGASIGMNKATSSFSWSMVVGSYKPSNSKAYVYEFNGTSWINTFTLLPDSSSIYPLTFYPTLPIVVNYPNTMDSFGHSVAMYADSVIVGAPTDRIIQEYESSSLYQQGAVYFFDRCANKSFGYYLARKSYGNEKIMKNNLLGWSVSIFDQYAVAGIPKLNCESSSICYIQGSLFQAHFCEDNLEETLNGQYALYNKTIGSIPDTTFVDWDVVNIYQIKKRYLYPYRVFGWDVCVCNQFITVGSPMLISGENTQISFYKEAPFLPPSLSVSSGSAILNWIYNGDYLEQDGFNIEKSFDGTTYNQIFQLESPDSRSYTDPFVSVSNTYWYRINAYNSIGVSPYSNTASITFYPQPPSGSIVLSVISGSAILNWTYVDTTQVGWNVEKSTDGISYGYIASVAHPLSRSYTDLAVVSNNTTYWYRVYAYDQYAQTSSYSNTASIFFGLPLPTGSITLLSVDTGSMISQSFGSGSSILSWSFVDNHQDGFNIYRSSSVATGFFNIYVLSSSVSRSYADPTIDANATYSYEVQPYNIYGTGSFSNVLSDSFSNILYLSGSNKLYADPTGFIGENNSSWKAVYGYKNIHMTNLDVSMNSLSVLQLVSASALTVLTCSNNLLTSLDVSTNPAITWLVCSANLLTNISLNSGSALRTLYCDSNYLPSLNVASCSGLVDFNCSVNQLTTLDVTHNLGLGALRCYNNHLTSLDLTKTPVCGYIDVGNNPLTTLNMSGSGVGLLYAINCRLTFVDFENCPSLVWLNIQNNNFPTISIGHRSASLQVLGIDSNLISASGIFDCTAYPSMSTLYCNNNLITNLDFTQNIFLTQLQAYGDRYTTLNFTNCPDLGSIDVSIGSLTSLDVSKNDKLWLVSCHDNYFLTSISMSLSASAVFIGDDYSLPVTGSTGINQVYIDLDNHGLTLPTSFTQPLTLNARGSRAPSGSAAETARNNLLMKGWTIDDSFGILTYTPSSSLVGWTDMNGTFGPVPLAGYWSSADSGSVKTLRLGSGSFGGQPLVSISGLQYLPKLQTMSCYRNSMSFVDLTNCYSMSYFSGSNNIFTRGAVNSILNWLDIYGVISGSVYLDQQIPPAPPTTSFVNTPDGLAASASLKLKGWVVVTD